MDAPSGTLTEEDRDLLRRLKPDLLALLDTSLAPDDLPPDWQELWVERAAIMEFDGGLCRERAEALALANVLDQMRRADCLKNNDACVESKYSVESEYGKTASETERSDTPGG